jgi:uncharacterized protein YkwD
MWQNFRTRLTQRSARRRNHLGALACLMAVLFTGVLIGRLTDDVEPAGRIYLNESAPPAAAKAPTPTPKKMQPYAGRIARRTTTAVPPGRARVRPTKSPENAIPGHSVKDPTRVLGDDSAQLSTTMAARVVSLTNAARVQRGCRRLRVDDRLTRSARLHSLEMAKSGQFTHNSPSGASPWDRMDQAGYHEGAAENIGRGYTSPEEAVRGWLDSPDHRQNILNCHIATIGVGVVSGAGGPWWTQDFGYS